MDSGVPAAMIQLCWWLPLRASPLLGRGWGTVRPRDLPVQKRGKKRRDKPPKKKNSDTSPRCHFRMRRVTRPTIPTFRPRHQDPHRTFLPTGNTKLRRNLGLQVGPIDTIWVGQADPDPKDFPQSFPRYQLSTELILLAPFQ